MMATPRASWKGYLTIAEVTLPVTLYAAASASDRIALHTVNRMTGSRVQRQYIDVETREPVRPDDQVKGYAVGKDQFIMLDEDEIAAATPTSDKKLTVSAFVAVDEIDDIYLDRPYFLAPSDRSGDAAFTLICEGLQVAGTAAIAEGVLFRRVRTLLIRSYDRGLAAATLNFNYQVRTTDDGFADVPSIKTRPEMLELAEHIIKTKQRDFDPRSVGDRCEAALAELVKAKLEGRTIAAPERERRPAMSDLMTALRESANLNAKPRAAKPRSTKTPGTPRRKAS